MIATASTTPIDPTGLPSQPAFIAVHHDAKRLTELAQAAAAGELAVPVAKRLPLEGAAEAQRLVEAGGQGGKIVLEP
jgi:NADPH:quinone reductase-like Zn-dependent oxidoreductase